MDHGALWIDLTVWVLLVAMVVLCVLAYLRND